jgi:hypothetical protein
MQFFPDRRNLASRRALIERVAGEFFEMPCLRLTDAQARRLFSLREDVCQRVLAGLIVDGTLVRGDDGRYRVTEHAGASALALVH